MNENSENTNSSPKISVIMPVYNGEAFLSEAIQSILNQTFSDFELLVVNDASTDRTEEIIKEFSNKDQRVKLLNNEFEKGIVGGLNTALKHSTGELIARADADDILREYRFADQVSFLGANPQIDVLGGGFAPFRSAEWSKPSKGHIRDIFHPGYPIELGWKMICNAYFCHPSIMFRRKVYEEAGGYPLEKSEDFVYFSKILRTHQGSNLQEILLDYREHEKNLSKTNASGISESAKAAFESNYRFYIPDGKLMDSFYRFAENKQLMLAEMIPLWIINVRIVNQIRKNYKLRIFNYQFWRFLSKLKWMMFKIMWGKLVSKF